MKALFVVLALGVVVSPAMAQDPSAGEKVFGRCRACHQVGERAKNVVGPHLNGLFGRPAGAVAGFNYSAANKGSGITWNEANFAEYITDPKKFMPGNKMAFAGVKKAAEIADLTAYVQQFGPDGKKK